MKRVHLNNNIKIIGIKNFKNECKKVDYYLITKENEYLYAFTNEYTRNAYDMCKAGIAVNSLIGRRTRDNGIMKLVKRTNRMLPYLAEYYELPLVA